MDTNGIGFGTPTNSDLGTNILVVSLTDTNGVSASASMFISVIPDPASTFLLSSF